MSFVIDAIHEYTPSAEPPWHEPALPQFSTCCTARLMSTPAPLRAILMRSPSAEMAPWAQQLPQYCRRQKRGERGTAKQLFALR